MGFGLGEGLADHILDANAGGGIPRSGRRARDRPSRGIAGALRIFSQRKLQSRRRAFENQSLRVLAPAQLDGDALPADGVRRAVQHVDSRQSAGQRAVNRDVLRIDHILDVGHR